MSERAGFQAGFGGAPPAGAAAGGRGGRGGARGRGGPRGRGGRGGRGKDAEREWQPVTKLGRLVKERKITTIEEIYLHSLPIKVLILIDCLTGMSRVEEKSGFGWSL